MSYLFQRLFLIAILLVSGNAIAQVEGVIDVADDDVEMNAAIENAKKHVDKFIEYLSDPNVDTISVKVPIEERGEVEHFWLSDIQYKDGKFTGTINNYPVSVKTVKFGQNVTVKKEEISDWMYMKDNKIHGNYTLRAMLKSMPEEKAEKFRSILADVEE